MGSKFKKKWLLLTLVFVLAFGSSITSYAVSCKNPTLTAEGKTKKCPYCGKKNEYIRINLHKGHNIKEVKLDGKKLDISKASHNNPSYYDNGKCRTCGTGIKSADLMLKKGTHKVEVRDDKGYWIIDYVTIKTKACYHGENNFRFDQGWYVE